MMVLRRQRRRHPKACATLLTQVNTRFFPCGKFFPHGGRTEITVHWGFRYGSSGSGLPAYCRQSTRNFSTGRQLVVSELLPERELGQFARRGVGKLLDEHDVVRYRPLGGLAFV